jgi:hypothetical protein
LFANPSPTAPTNFEKNGSNSCRAALMLAIVTAVVVSSIGPNLIINRALNHPPQTGMF